MAHLRVVLSLFFKARSGTQLLINLHGNENVFSYESVSARTRFEKEAQEYLTWPAIPCFVNTVTPK